MKNVLVTGASGFIGRQCVPFLISQGYRVHAVSSRSINSAPPNVIWHQVDLLKPDQVSQLVATVMPDCLLHLAWYTVPGKYWESQENLRWVQASLELLQVFAEHGGKRLVVAGSCAEYGEKNDDCDEDETFFRPTTLYGSCKHCLQEILDHWSRQTGVSWAWGRVFSLYGPYEHPARLVPYVIRSLLSDQPAICFEGLQVRDFLHVEDVASAFVRLLVSQVQGPVNIASGLPVSVRTLVETIGQKIGRPHLIHRRRTIVAHEAPRVTGRPERLLRETDWRPCYNLSSGLDQTITWWKNAAALSQKA